MTFYIVINVDGYLKPNLFCFCAESEDEAFSKAKDQLPPAMLEHYCIQSVDRTEYLALKDEYY